MRTLKTIATASLLTLGLAIGVTACQDSVAPKETACTQTDLSVRCLLELGDIKLKDIPLSFERVSGAMELAVAYDSSNKPQAAAKLINQALTEAKALSDIKQRGNAYSEILVAIASIKPHADFKTWALDIENNTSELEVNKQADILAKTVIAQMVHGDKTAALKAGLDLPQTTATEENYKAVTLRKLAGLLAKSGDFKASQQAVNAITMSIPYYQSMVRSDVARYANKADKTEMANTLLVEAEPIARGQDNGYFIAAALRDIGYTHAVNGDMKMAQPYFNDAHAAAAKATKQNEKARSTSRIATRMSDAGLGAQTQDILNSSVVMAGQVEAKAFQQFSYYEITGSAAFSGQFDISYGLLDQIDDSPMGSTSSLKGAAQRDLAWGLARHGKLEEAVSLAKSITASRESLQALSRIIRLQNNPKMTALPRYL